GNRETAADTLGAGQDVRGHAAVHVGVEFAGTTHAALHLIEDQQCIVLVTERPHRLKVFGTGRDHPALALYRLQHHGTGALGDLRFQGSNVIVRHVADSTDGRTEALGVLGLATHADGEQGPTMEAVAAGDDLVLVRTDIVVRAAPGQLAGRFVGFGAGVDEQHTVREGRRHELGRQAQRRFVGHDVGYMTELLRLTGEYLDQFRVGVTQRVDRDAAGQVDVFATLLVPQARSLPSHRHHIDGGVIGHHVPIEVGAADLHGLRHLLNSPVIA